MRAKKLKSGSWYCKPQVNNKRRSFTVKDPSLAGKRECERLASEWAASEKRAGTAGCTVYEAIEAYIDARDGSLSPSTIRAYKSTSKALSALYNIKLSALRERDVTAWLREYRKTHSPKSCANTYGLLSSAIKEAAGISFDIRLPDPVQKEYIVPTDEEVKRLIAYVREKDPVLEKAVLLAAFGTLRRGEVCAVRYSDIHGNSIEINKSIAHSGGGKYVQKAPKNVQSIRTITLPSAVIKRLKKDSGDDRIVPLTPSVLSNRFRRALKNVDCPPFRYHDLRAYSASIRHALNIPDQYIMSEGGWKTPAVLRKIYVRSMPDKRDEFSKIANKHFRKVMSTKVSTKK